MSDFGKQVGHSTAKAAFPTSTVLSPMPVACLRALEAISEKPGKRRRRAELVTRN
jgi:hypothetical protein